MLETFLQFLCDGAPLQTLAKLVSQILKNFVVLNFLIEMFSVLIIIFSSEFLTLQDSYYHN